MDKDEERLAINSETECQVVSDYMSKTTPKVIKFVAVLVMVVILATLVIGLFVGWNFIKLLFSWD